MHQDQNLNRLWTRSGDRVPGLWINKDGHFYFHLTRSDNTDDNYHTNIDFVLGKTYHVTIQQSKEGNKYWYEIVIDGVSILKRENKQPKRFSNVKMYASDPWHAPFTSDLGSISHIKVEQGEGKYF